MCFTVIINLFIQIIAQWCHPRKLTANRNAPPLGTVKLHFSGNSLPHQETQPFAPNTLGQPNKAPAELANQEFTWCYHCADNIHCKDIEAHLKANGFSWNQVYKDAQDAISIPVSVYPEAEVQLKGGPVFQGLQQALLNARFKQQMLRVYKWQKSVIEATESHNPSDIPFELARFSDLGSAPNTVTAAEPK